jgi:two-component system, NarL family, nitrate/nitrite response regulator NarL
MDEFGVFLIDSDRLFREGLKRILEEGAYRTAGEARSIAEAAAAVERAGRVDLVILDPADWAAEGAAAFFAGLRARGAKIVVLTSDRSGGAIGRAVGAAVDAYLLKDMSPDALTRSLQLVLLGQQIFPTRLMESLLLAEGAGPVAGSPGAGTALSRREVQILRHLMGGESNKAIARELGISEATVKVHLKGLLRKVRASNRTQAAVWAMNNGIADQAP